MLVKFLKGNISPIHQVESTCSNRNLVHHPGIVNLAWREHDKCGNRASQIHQCMYLERALTMMKLGPWTQLKTQFNGTAVKRIYHLLKTNSQLFILVKQLHCKCADYEIRRSINGLNYAERRIGIEFGAIQDYDRRNGNGE